MCDTLVALPHFNKNGHLIFAKNSDREPDEAQALLHFPRRITNSPKVQCTYIQIPQIKETYEVILSKPFQMWGAEMGINEFGLVVGNEAVFTRVKIKKTNSGLTGMDMLRLALERSKNAKEAVHCITQLLHTYGQNACGGYKNKAFFYHNSFIIADSLEAFILETAGKSWALKKIESIGTISNGLTIHSDYDQLHLEDESLGFPYQFIPKPKPFSFSQYFSDFLYTTVGKAKVRQSCSLELLQDQKGEFSVEKAMAILKTHAVPDPLFNPKKATTASLCMHTTGITNPSTTTGSMVAEVRKGYPATVWLTGTSMPCLSIYIPFFLGTQTLYGFMQPSSSPDGSLWWKAEQVHQWICKDYQNRKSSIQGEITALQLSFIKKEFDLIAANSSLETLERFSGDCLRKAESFYDVTLSKIS